jgi:hypothetical protein
LKRSYFDAMRWFQKAQPTRDFLTPRPTSGRRRLPPLPHDDLVAEARTGGRVRTRVLPVNPGRVRFKDSDPARPGYPGAPQSQRPGRPGYPGAPQMPAPGPGPGTRVPSNKHPSAAPGSTRVERRACQGTRPTFLPGGLSKGGLLVRVVRLILTQPLPIKKREQNSFLAGPISVFFTTQLGLIGPNLPGW